MDDLLSELPDRFRAVRYDGAKIPDGSHALSDGANCQLYAFAVLAHFGIDLPPWRSSELWADTALTEQVTLFQPLDLLLFNPTAEPFGGHVAVYAGAGQALHLAKSVGQPAIWSLAEFAAQPQHRVLIGGKRFRSTLLSPLEGEGRPDAFSGRFRVRGSALSHALTLAEDAEPLIRPSGTFSLKGRRKALPTTIPPKQKRPRFPEAVSIHPAEPQFSRPLAWARVV